MTQAVRAERLLLFTGAVRRDPAVQGWLESRSGELGAIAREWFERLRACGPDVVELMHDGAPTVCVGEAAFAYVNAYKAHINVGFFRGAWLPDPAELLQGDGKYTRHVKLRPGEAMDSAALQALVAAAYRDIRTRLDIG
jgi:hypothetical protein